MSTLSKINKKLVILRNALEANDEQAIHCSLRDIEELCVSQSDSPEQLAAQRILQKLRAYAVLFEHQVDKLEQIAPDNDGDEYPRLVQRKKHIELLGYLSNLSLQIAHSLNPDDLNGYLNEKILNRLVADLTTHQLMAVESINTSSRAHHKVVGHYQRLTLTDGQHGEFDARNLSLPQAFEIIKKHREKTYQLQASADAAAYYYKLAQMYADVMRRMQFEDAIIVIRKLESLYQQAVIDQLPIEDVQNYKQRVATYIANVDVSSYYRQQLLNEVTTQFCFVDLEDELFQLLALDIDNDKTLSSEEKQQKHFDKRIKKIGLLRELTNIAFIMARGLNPTAVNPCIDDALFKRQLIDQLIHPTISFEAINTGSGSHQKMVNRFYHLTQHDKNYRDFDARNSSVDFILQQLKNCRQLMLSCDSASDTSIFYYKLAHSYAELTRRFQFDYATQKIGEYEARYRQALVLGKPVAFCNAVKDMLTDYCDKADLTSRDRRNLRDESKLRFEIVELEVELAKLATQNLDKLHYLEQESEISQNLVEKYEELSSIFSLDSVDGIRETNSLRAKSTLARHHSLRAKSDAETIRAESYEEPVLTSSTRVRNLTELSDKIADVADEAQYTLPNKERFYRQCIREAIASLTMVANMYKPGENLEAAFRQSLVDSSASLDIQDVEMPDVVTVDYVYQKIADLYYNLAMSYMLSRNRRSAEMHTALRRFHSARNHVSNTKELSPRADLRTIEHPHFKLLGELKTIFCDFKVGANETFDAFEFFKAITEFLETVNVIDHNADALQMYANLETRSRQLFAIQEPNDLNYWFGILSSKSFCDFMNKLCWITARRDNAIKVIGPKEDINTFLDICGRLYSMTEILQNSLQSMMIMSGLGEPRYELRMPAERFISMTECALEPDIISALKKTLKAFQNQELRFIRELPENDIEMEDPDLELDGNLSDTGSNSSSTVSV